MLPFVYYMLKVIICSGILFGYYWLLLRNKVFHRYNRFYLLAAVVLSLALPLIQIGFWQHNEQQNSMIKVLQVVSSGDEYLNEVIVKADRSPWSLQELYPYVYLLVSALFVVMLTRTLLAIRRLLKKYPVQLLDKISFVNTNDKSTPFSFLSYIFWNSNIDPESATGRQIFKHEVAHVQEKHTYDKLFINIVLIAGWCNPFFWLIRRELSMIHEFIADKKAIGNSDTAAFAAMILQAAYPQQLFQVSNNFFYSPIKRRLMMLTKTKNPRVNYIARVMVLPLAVLIFAAFTFKAKTNSSLYTGKKITVVIDAGHGGKDAGAISADGSTSEKDLDLAIAKKIKALNSNDNINILLTREDDSFSSVFDKAKFAGEQQPDLFISVHVDNGPKNAGNTQSGMSVWIAKDEYPNSVESRVLASAIINEFSNNYGLPVMPYPNQRQQGIWVLQASYPAVLVETGFINNNKDLGYLQTEAAKETIARNILAAIEKFAGQKRQINISPLQIPVADTFPSKSTTGVNPGNAQPLYIIDGKETDKLSADNIKPDDIQEVKVLKDESAIRLYGEKGRNGVIIISTKQAAGAKITAESADLKKAGTASAASVEQQKKLADEQAASAKLQAEKQPMQKTAAQFSASQEQQKKLADEQEALSKLQAEKQLQQNSNGDGSGNAKLTQEKLAAEKEASKLNQVIFTKAETEASFPGGQNEWTQYLIKNANASLPVIEGWKPGTYTVLVKFIVHNDGSISDVETENYKGTKTAKHCIELIKNGPKWQPALQNGLAVNIYRKQPITFVVEEQK